MLGCNTEWWGLWWTRGKVTSTQPIITMFEKRPTGMKFSGIFSREVSYSQMKWNLPVLTENKIQILCKPTLYESNEMHLWTIWGPPAASLQPLIVSHSDLLRANSTGSWESQEWDKSVKCFKMSVFLFFLFQLFDRQDAKHEG